jgi:hypothetical protein
MISENDSQNTFDGGKYYIITNGNKELIDNLKSKFEIVPVETGFNYNSRDNDQKETIKSLKEKINKILNE